LNKPINSKWEACFRKRANAFSVNVSSANMTFHRDRAMITVNERFLPQAVEMFKNFCAAANEEYAALVQHEHMQENARRRAALEARVAQQERKLRILE